MNTPTPEDRELAEEMDEYWCIDIDSAARLIANHCAPLRELAEIGRLAVEEYQSAQAKDRVALLDACFDYVAKERKS